MEYGLKLKNARSLKGYSQMEFSEICKIPYETYKRYEVCDRLPKAEYKKRFAEALEINSFVLDPTDMSYTKLETEGDLFSWLVFLIENNIFSFTIRSPFEKRESPVLTFNPSFAALLSYAGEPNALDKSFGKLTGILKNPEDFYWINEKIFGITPKSDNLEKALLSWGQKYEQAKKETDQKKKNSLGEQAELLLISSSVENNTPLQKEQPNE